MICYGKQHTGIFLVLGQISGCEFLKTMWFMLLVISNPVSTVSNSHMEGVIILSLLIKIWRCWRDVKNGVYLEELEVEGTIILKRVIKFEQEEVIWIGVFQDKENWIGFVNTVLNIWFHKGCGWVGIVWMYEKVSFLRTLLYLTQSINTYIDSVCPDRLILRYCSCNTYLLHRRAELKAAPCSTWLMWNWTLGRTTGTVYLYICSRILLCLKRAKLFDPFSSGRFLYYEYYLWVFLHNSPSISYLVETVWIMASHLFLLNIDARITNFLIYIKLDR